MLVSSLFIKNLLIFLKEVKTMNIKLRDEYLLKRRKKKITMQEIAEYIGCSQSLISRYETGNCGMSKEKIQKYREYIDQK